MSRPPSSSSSVLASVFAPALALLATACSDGPAHRPGGGAPTGLVVVHSDFQSSAVSLLDGATGAVTNPDCINSGSTPPGITLALSGDVVLPSWPLPGNPVVTIDRTNGALTWLDPATCTALRQLDVSTGFRANPHDVIGLSATKAYVTRYERNAAPTADPADRDDGDDLLIIDPSVPAITGRIDLASHAVAVAGAQIQARPDRARLIDDQLFVVLNNVSGDFKALGHGRVVAIDTATDQVTATIDIPELFNCGGLAYVEATQTLVVTCAGDFTAADAALTSGVAYIDVSPVALIRDQMAAAFGGRALGAYSGVANDGTLGFAVTPGVFGGPPTDQLWSFDVATGQATKLADASDSFTFGTVLSDPAHKRMYLTDADFTTPRVHVYDYASGTAVLETSIDTDPLHGLPPRELAWY
jgi:hypothetical protein